MLKEAVENRTCHFCVHHTNTSPSHSYNPSCFKFLVALHGTPNLKAMCNYNPYHVGSSFATRDMPVFTLQNNEPPTSAMHYAK